VPQQRLAGEHRPRGRLPDRHRLQPRVQARVRDTAGRLAAQPRGAPARGRAAVRLRPRAPERRTLLKRLPLLLTALRAALAPLIVLLALLHPTRAAFGACLLAGFLSDVFDGILARRLGVATPRLRRLDSAADTLFYLAVAICAWRLYPQALTRRAGLLALLLALEIARYVLDWLRFGREASYHTWSAKLFGVLLFAGCFALLALGVDNAALTAALWCGIFSDLEGVAISFTLRQWRTDVPTLWHALHWRRAVWDAGDGT